MKRSGCWSILRSLSRIQVREIAVSFYCVMSYFFAINARSFAPIHVSRISDPIKVT
jgi:hypothetical protein